VRALNANLAVLTTASDALLTARLTAWTRLMLSALR
jgi:hypothetical protein